MQKSPICVRRGICVCGDPGLWWWRETAADRQVEDLAESKGARSLGPLLSFAEPAVEDKPVPKAACFGVNDCSASGNILVSSRRADERDTDQWIVAGMTKACIMWSG